jgi:hypothetical protein
VDIVFDLQVIGYAGIGTGYSVVPDVLAGLDLSGVVVQVALSVQVEVNDMIAKSSQLGTASLCRADRIRGSTRMLVSNVPRTRESQLVPHISREVAKNIV